MTRNSSSTGGVPNLNTKDDTKDFPGRDLSNANFFGHDLSSANFEHANLFNASLVGARLEKANIRGADLRGVDLRGADLSGADLTGCLFLTQAQIDSALGDRETVLPDHIVRPAHWDGR